MALSERFRPGDEADAVDHQFSTRVLEWLGFGRVPSSVEHNRARDGGIPDHMAIVNAIPVVVWEDKNTTEGFDVVGHERQLSRYAQGRASYAVWTNARRLIGFRVEPAGTLVRLVDIDVLGVFGLQGALEGFIEETEAKLAYFRLLLSARRFIEVERLSEEVAVDEATFLARAVPLTGHAALETFLGGAREVLEGLRLAGLAGFREAAEVVANSSRVQGERVQQWEADAESYLVAVGAQGTAEVRESVKTVGRRLGTMGNSEVREILGGLPAGGGVSAATGRFRAATLRANAALMSQRLDTSPHQRVVDAYQVWMEQQSEEESSVPEVYAQQVAYVFFVRLFLARILEDKGIVRPRIASDGGFQAWRRLLSTQDIEGQAYMALMSRRVGVFYRHFYRQPVFDWFVPDDYLFLRTLHFLSHWKVDSIDSDVLGFTYENYLDRVVRNKKGHFLTRPETVEYMLDLLGYRGREVIGRSVVDPACGSGSFLVHCARRYRAALAESFARGDGSVDEVGLARQFVRDIARLYVGMDIEPFAAYLAELNLLIQVLDDVQVLMAAGENPSLDRFEVYRTDSLDLPEFVLVGAGPPSGVGFDAEVDEGFAIKARDGAFSTGFSYVVANPPYINPKQHHGAARHGNAPFFSRYLGGDTNTYLMFLTLGVYLLGHGGRMAMIVPLTVVGDQSAAGVREMICTPPHSPTEIVRFYTGNVLFRGVDQATCIVVVGSPAETVGVGGGTTIEGARASETRVESERVLSATPADPPWGRSFLVSPDALAYSVWAHVQGVCSISLGELIQRSVMGRQGDFNATYVNPCRIGGRGAEGPALGVYKGENILRYAPLPEVPSDWVTASASRPLSGPEEAARRAVESLLNLTECEAGIALRETARLNTRRRLIATWFERDGANRIGFSHEVWRMLAQPQKVVEALALLGLLNSAMVAFLYNLFSTNNHITQSDLARVRMPDLRTLQIGRVAGLVEEALACGRSFELDYVRGEGATVTGGTAAVDPSAILARSHFPTLTVGDLVRRGDIQVGRVDSAIGSLLSSGRLSFSDSMPAAVYSRFLDSWHERKLAEVMDVIEVPDVGAASEFGRLLEQADREAQDARDRFLDAERAIDGFIFDWYRVPELWRAPIAEGLPWAR